MLDPSTMQIMCQGDKNQALTSNCHQMSLWYLKATYTTSVSKGLRYIYVPYSNGPQSFQLCRPAEAGDRGNGSVHSNGTLCACACRSRKWNRVHVFPCCLWGLVLNRPWPSIGSWPVDPFLIGLCFTLNAYYLLVAMHAAMLTAYFH